MAPAPWFPPIPPVTCGFWNATNVQGFLKEFHNTLDLAEAIIANSYQVPFNLNFSTQA
ncbi:hypothetical protein HanXRQr2_Chr03g0112431 [Helianthus annuus]|uniref:Uncharacterized protein n=1 Tax=Helianthus annuus TaxID=4232 RepID=A0A9K3NX29_HELAN|nr:hypothetical protein HanXRQr2_Chr03g0112431 [Helianthus annuus]KAJ0943782.1 hypothetical protein HanPSC8_Chr03g0108751 [Helianthus annuus]